MNPLTQNLNREKKAGTLQTSVLAILFFLFAVFFYITHGFGLFSVQPKNNLNDYGWAELKAIADQIEGADCVEDGLKIAKEFNLVLDNGYIDSNNTKTYALKNGDSYQIGILGILCDDKADGTGKAAITFYFKQSVAERGLNEKGSNAGGWAQTDCRTWLNKNFIDILRTQGVDNKVPDYMVAAVKPAPSFSKNDGNVSTTNDRLWLLSTEEIFSDYHTGSLNSDNHRNDHQYQLFAENEIAKHPSSFEYNEGFWLRTADWDSDSRFFMILPDGTLSSREAYAPLSLFPAFCM